MRQFLLPRSYTGGRTVTFTGKDYHYLCRVRRLRPGDTLRGIDEAGATYTLRLLSLDGRSCTCASEPETKAGESAGGTTVTLYQCLPKGKKLDLIIRQVTEAGISRIVPVESERSVRRAEAGDTGRLERWTRIAREALQQSGGAGLPEILDPIRFSDIAPPGGEGALGLFFHQEDLSAPSLHGLLATNPSALSYVVGPEGGLSDAEVAILGELGYRPVFLGANILRTETAALYGLAAIKLLLLEIDSWKPT